MKRQHIVVAYLKKSKRSDADGTETCAVFSYYCLFRRSICIYFKKVYADNSDSGLFFCT